MSSDLHKLQLSTLIFLLTVLDYPTTTTPQECPYPCYPPPAGPGNNPPVATTPPVSTTPPASFSPPFSTTPPAGFLPLTPPPPNFLGGAPPPPDPVVPWFPYYYRKPPHQDQSFSSPALIGSRNIIVLMFSVHLALFYVIH